MSYPANTAGWRCVLSALAAGCSGVTVVAFHATLGWGLLQLAQPSPRDPYVLVLVVVQWVIAGAAVTATVELSRLQRLWLDLPVRTRLVRHVAFLLAWMTPALAGFLLGTHADHAARGVLVMQGLGVVLATLAIEVRGLAEPGSRLPSPLRHIFRLGGLR